MNKKELKKYLNIYSLIKKDVGLKKVNSIIKLYGRKKIIDIPIWLFELDSILKDISSAENDGLISKIIDEVYQKGTDDKRIISFLPITESGYYRMKRQIEEKIYELYILKGFVSQTEIMKNKIME